MVLCTQNGQATGLDPHQAEKSRASAVQAGAWRKVLWDEAMRAVDKRCSDVIEAQNSGEELRPVIDWKGISNTDCAAVGLCCASATQLDP